ncbi:MAG: protein kinase [Planctomycetes bacterium]|nr:protein kinase [Planctomycetota bacterium]
MSTLEDLVEDFLVRREHEPDLTPEQFAAVHGGAGSELLSALSAALDAEALLGTVALPRPDWIGPYRIVRELGRGGMGVVYEAERDGERAAVKVLLHAHMRGPRALERFRREAAALRRVEHTGVVRVRDEGVVEGAPWLAMDLVLGRPLTELVGRTEPRAAAEVLRAMAVALQAVHSSGVLHRDLKPSNVLLDADDKPVLCDFGLVQSEDEGSLTSTGELLGTPRYMAPEQVLGQACDARTDVHALGLILFELVCGQHAHEGHSREEILSGVLRGVVRRPRSIAPGIPRALEKIILQATALEPARRYATAHALAEDLARFLAGEPVHARPPGIAARAWRTARTAPRRTLAIGSAIAATVFVVGYLASRPAPVSVGPEVVRALDRSAWAWVDGHERLARRHALIARGLAPTDTDVAALSASIERGPFDALATPTPRSGLAEAAGALERARAARIAGRVSEAGAILQSALAAHPQSAALAAESAWLHSESGDFTEARARFERAINLDADNPLAHEALATWCFERGETRSAVEAAHTAALLASREGEPPTRLPKLLERSTDHAALQAILRERLAVDPDDDYTRFALAVSLDSDHLLGAAAVEYADLVRRRPDHAFALAYLGYLQLGALGDRCARCVEAFQHAPEVPDRAQGSEHLVRALHIDAGRDEDLLRTIVSIALDKGLREPVSVELRSLLDVRERSARTARLESALRRLE